MRSKQVSLRLPCVLLDALTIRWKSLNYPSFVAYVIGLIRYDLLTIKPHEITQPWVDLPFAMQDEIDDGLLRIVNSGEAQRGSFLRALIKEVIEEKKANVPVEEISKALSAKITAFAKETK